MNNLKSIFNKNNFIAVILTLFITITTTVSVNAISNWQNDYYAYGSGLSQQQLVESERLVGLPDDQEFTKIIVTGDDYKQFTGINMTDSNMYSSAVVQKTKEGSGVQVYINTPDNITQIKDHQYMNAALTSGITDCTIVVVSPIPVTGESALIGVYKALEDAGYELNEEATKVATEELTVVNEISQDNEDNKDFDSKDFSLAMNDMKQQISEIADKGSITIEQINVIVNDVLNKNNITINEADKEKLISWLDDFKELDIDWDLIKKELSGLKDLVSKKAGEIYDWGQKTGFFENLWKAIKDFFDSIFN